MTNITEVIQTTEQTTDFKSFNIPEFLLGALNSIGIKSPTPVQIQTIPTALQGRDVLASAQTGTGKTIAYLIPLIAHLSTAPNAKGVVLAPTRELATQIKEAAYQLLNGVKGINIALLIGGEQMFKQMEQLKRAPRLIIGTPGRINDHLNRGSLKLKETSFFVLDETDRMLDMGFTEQLDAIQSFLPEEHQTLMFSATLPSNILNLSKKYLNNPERIAVGPENTPSPRVKQDIIHTSENDKFTHLLRELSERTGSVIIFVKTKRGADNLAEMLKDESHKANAIHGDLQQSRRERVILAFRNGKYRILVATDVAARGLDVPHIEHVINFDLPMQAEDYIHRIGRTGRAGAEGQALSFISPDDQRKWRLITQLIDPTAPKLAASTRSPYGNRNSSNSRGSSFGRSSFGGGAARSGDRRDGFGGGAARSGERRDSFGGGASGSGDRRGGFGANASGSGDRRGGFGANASGSGDRRGGFGPSASGSGDRRGGFGAGAAGSGDRRGGFGAGAAGSGDRRRSGSNPRNDQFRSNSSEGRRGSSKEFDRVEEHFNY